jgi:hypothetical protein
MLLCSSRVFALRSGLIVAAILAFAPTAAAQGTATAPKKPAAAPATAAPSTSTPATATPATAAPATAAPATVEPATEPGREADGNRAIYISADIGFVRADMSGISNNTGLDKTAANGVVAGIGLGYRFKELRLGARFHDANTTEFSLWSLVGEIGYGLPFRPVSPVLVAHAGYMFSNGVERGAIGSALPPGNVLTPQVQLDGLVVGGELLASVWITKFLRLGPFVGIDFSWLHRAQVALPQSIVPLTADTRNNALYTDSGSGVGYLLSIGLRGTGDIAF